MHCFLPVILHAALGAAWNIGEEVKTSSGTVKGHASTWQPEVSEYLGIPFAQPPTGPLRFAAPQPFQGSGPIDGSKFGDDCPSPGPALGGSMATGGNKTIAGAIFSEVLQLGRPMSDNCLTLNVWTKPQTGDKAKAVLLWIYGGAFYIGNTAAKPYSGARLANDNDVIVVSANYRTNIFGFPGAPGLKDQNVGLLDQRRAIEWVRDNIAGFGGDPKRITIFGESAGGASTDTYAYTWLKDPIVNGIISQSGTISLVPWIGNRGSGAWFAVSQKMGCGGPEAGEKAVDCMRTKDPMDLIKNMGASGSPLAGGFGPTADGRSYFNDAQARAKSGNFAKVPILVGSNENEGGIIAAATGGSGGSAAGLTSAVTSIVGSVMGSIVTCGARDAARARVAAGVKAWRYRYYGVWPNQAISPTAGSYHASDVPIVFGTGEYVTGRPDTPDEAAVVKLMGQAWAEFAKDPVNGLEKLKWPVFDEAKPTLIRLGFQNKPEVTFVEQKQHDGQCASLPALTSMLTGPNSSTPLAAFVGGALGPAPKGSAPKGFAPKGSAPKGSVPKGTSLEK